MTKLLPQLTIRCLQERDYQVIWQKMRDFTAERDKDTQDEIWLVEHDPVFTQGQNGKAEHLLNPGDIPVVQTDRGGQITYHGPGQLVIYFLIDIRRLGLGVRPFVTAIEQSTVAMLKEYGINASTRSDAPGVYVEDAKICSLGLRIRKGFSYHGLALNVDMDLEPFTRINPCGFSQLKMTQLADFIENVKFDDVAPQLLFHLCQHLHYNTDNIGEPESWS